MGQDRSGYAGCDVSTYQAQQPAKAITSNIPLEKQVEGTMFEPPKPKEMTAEIFASPTTF